MRLTIEQVIEKHAEAVADSVRMLVADLRLAGCTQDQIAREVSVTFPDRHSVRHLFAWALTPRGAKAVVEAAGGSAEGVPIQILVGMAAAAIGGDEGKPDGQASENSGA